MRTAEFIVYLRSLNVRLWVDGDQLCCSAPTGVLTPSLQSELTACKGEILSFLLASDGGATAHEASLCPIPRGGPLPLSFAQQRLWFLDQLVPGSTAYNMPRALEIQGRLDVAALGRALTEITRRHEALRTRFVAVDGRPMQQVAPAAPFLLPVADLTHLPEVDREVEARRLANEEALRPFDLARDPLLRGALLRLGEDHHVFLYTMHHIVSDGWSRAVFNRELATLYRTSASGNPSPLPELPIQYADFAVWQREWLRGEVLERQLAYWRRQLEGLTPLELPTTCPRPAKPSYRGARASFSLSPTLTRALKALSQREGVTLFMTLLAAFQVLLSRYTGQDDIAVGTPIANRNRAEIEGLIGFFVNSLVLRTNLSGDPSFRELLGRVREVTLGAYAHQDLPFEKLVEELAPERDLGRAPLFQVTFALQNAPRSELQLHGLTVKPFKVSHGRTRFDLEVHLWEAPAGLLAWFVYNIDLFDAETIERMQRHFSSLLESVIANPNKRLSEVELLSEAERHQLLVEWNQTQVEYPRDATITELFEMQAQKTPEAPAIVCRGQQITYQELNRRANRLAHYLRARRIKPGALVAICAERSFDMVIGLLGILKAGGAYVPLDPESPPDRLAYMLEDTQAAILLTQRTLRQGLPSHQAQVVELDAGRELLVPAPEVNPDCLVTAEDLAYVIYTSGSTGRPKGVAVAHRGVVNLSCWHQRVYNVTPADRATQLAAPAFDASVWEIWPYLTAGASLWIPDEETRAVPEKLVAWLADQQITLSFLPTPLAEAVLETQGLERLTLRALLTGGDRLHRAPRGPLGFTLVNHYGPTENSVVTTWTSVAPSSGTEAPPIGRPIANTRVYVLDSNRHPVPVGVPGELYVGGDGLARGYHNQTELTAEKFVSDPFSDDPGARLYRTGDLVRYRPDGAIEFLGRVDHQVKIRGFRVELGEIEAVLSQHPGVREAVVMAGEDTTKEKRLVAYVVPTAKDSLTTSSLRSFLEAKLPKYMIPSGFVLLDSLPLNQSGKVDHRALPALDPAASSSRPTFVPPVETVEHQLARIWEELLGVRNIGIQDDFFELGGHSLLAVRMMDRVERLCGRKLPLTTLFAGATIEHLARQLVEQHLAESHSLLVPIQSGGSKPPVFFLHDDFRGGGFYCLELARALGEDQPFYALIPHGLDGQPVPPSVEAMAESYVKVIRAVQPRGPYVLGGLCAGGVVAYEMARQLQRQGDKVPLVIMIGSSGLHTHYRLLHRLITGVGTLLGCQPAELGTLFVLWRNRVVRARSRYRSSSARLRYVLRWTLHPVHAAKRVYWSLIHMMASLGETHRESPIPDPPEDRHAHDPIERTIQAAIQPLTESIRRYMPRPFSGRVALFWPTELALDTRKDPTVGWGKVAREIEVYPVPGGFTTSVTTHVKILGEHLRACLAKAEAELSECPDRDGHAKPSSTT